MTLVFYDGVCGLCDRFVQFLLARDRRGRLRFAPLQGELARRELEAPGQPPADSDSIVVIAGWHSPASRRLIRSRAVLHAVGELGPGWLLLTVVARIVPRRVGDAAYAALARRRYGLFGRLDVCTVPRPEWRDRFLDEPLSR